MSRESLRSLDDLHLGESIYQSLLRRDKSSGEWKQSGIEDFYLFAQECELHAGVPDDVANHFLTARYAHVLAWYVYRFSSLGQTQALLSLEFGLRLRFASGDNAPKPGARPPTMKPLLMRGIKAGLLRDSRFRAWPGHRDSGMEDGIGWTSEYVIPLLLHFRNDFAHGSATLMPSGVFLALACDWLNQVYPAPGSENPEAVVL